MKTVVWLLLIALAAGVTYQYTLGNSPATPPQTAPVVAVSAFEVDARAFADRVEAIGTLSGNESVTLTANASDIVERIHFEEGQRVKAGQLLVTLSQQEELAQLAAAKADLAEQQREVRRLEGLVKQHSAAQTELDQRRTALDKARHKIEELEARIADRRLRAPFDGVLGLRLISPGALVSPGTAITTLDDIDTLKLDFSVPSALLGNLSLGQSLEARTAAYPETTFTGEIRVIDSRVNRVDRSIRARAEFDNAHGLLKPGMLMTVELLQNPRQAVVIPEEALLSRDRNHSVWVIDPERTLQRRDVTIGTRQPGWVEIRTGLEPGERIVRANFPRLREGVRVNVTSDGAG